MRAVSATGASSGPGTVTVRVSESLRPSLAHGAPVTLQARPPASVSVTSASPEGVTVNCQTPLPSARRTPVMAPPLTAKPWSSVR